MFRKILFCLFILLLFFSCSKKDKVNVLDQTVQDQGVEVYKQACQRILFIELIFTKKASKGWKDLFQDTQLVII